MCIAIRSPHTPFSIYLRGTICRDTQGYIGRSWVQGFGCPKIRGTLFRGPNNKDYGIALGGLCWGSLISGNSTVTRMTSSRAAINICATVQMSPYGGFPKLVEPFLGLQNTDFCILGSIWGPLILGNYHIGN